MNLQLQAGDIVCSTISQDAEPDYIPWTQRFFSLGIRQAQSFNDVDGKAKYTHSFIITNQRGRTFEALWTYKHQNIFSAYKGMEVLIGRHRQMTYLKAVLMHHEMKENFEGRTYPAWKLPLFLLSPRLMKYLPSKPVCSELCFWGLQQVCLAKFWKGVTPSFIEDAIRRWRDFQIIYEGKIE